MRKLSQREKILLGIVAILAVGVFIWIIGGDGGFSLGLSNLKTKKRQLDNVNVVIDLSKKTTAIPMVLWVSLRIQKLSYYRLKNLRYT